MATFVLTVIGDDRPGLVSAVSGPISAHGASWERSQLGRLAGKFAGIVLVSVPHERADALVEELQGLEAQGLHLTVERTDEPTRTDVRQLTLELLGIDRPGIVAEVSAALAAHGVSIEELSTDVRDAPMAGGTLFEAKAVLVAPQSAKDDQLRAQLEDIADELMVEITLTDE